MFLITKQESDAQLQCAMRQRAAASGGTLIDMPALAARAARLAAQVAD